MFKKLSSFINDVTDFMLLLSGYILFLFGFLTTAILTPNLLSLVFLIVY